jgi:hypothetical protein
VLGAEQRHQLELLRFVQHVDGAGIVAREAGVVRDQPHLLPLQAVEPALLEDVDAGIVFPIMSFGGLAASGAVMRTLQSIRRAATAKRRAMEVLKIMKDIELLGG